VPGNLAPQVMVGDGYTGYDLVMLTQDGQVYAARSQFFPSTWFGPFPVGEARILDQGNIAAAATVHWPSPPPPSPPLSTSLNLFMPGQDRSKVWWNWQTQLTPQPVWNGWVEVPRQTPTPYAISWLAAAQLSYGILLLAVDDGGYLWFNTMNSGRWAGWDKVGFPIPTTVARRMSLYIDSHGLSLDSIVVDLRGTCWHLSGCPVRRRSGRGRPSSATCRGSPSRRCGNAAASRRPDRRRSKGLLRRAPRPATI
jgi:hypothetical protein